MFAWFSVLQYARQRELDIVGWYREQNFTPGIMVNSMASPYGRRA